MESEQEGKKAEGNHTKHIIGKGNWKEKDIVKSSEESLGRKIS